MLIDAMDNMQQRYMGDTIPAPSLFTAPSTTGQPSHPTILNGTCYQPQTPQLTIPTQAAPADVITIMQPPSTATQGQPSSSAQQPASPVLQPQQTTGTQLGRNNPGGGGGGGNDVGGGGGEDPDRGINDEGQ